MITPTDNLDTLSENARILWINPLYTDVYNRAMADTFRQIVRPGTDS
jgi:allantoin racemase